MKKTTKNFKLHYLSRSKKALAFLLSALFIVLCCPISFAEESSADPLTPSELAQMSEDEVAAISQEQSDATLNKMVQLFQDGKKDALNEYLSALGLTTSDGEYSGQNDKLAEGPSIQPLWQSDNWSNPEKACHESLTSYGFLLYIGAMAELFNITGSYGYKLEDLQSLSKSSSWPDWDLEQNDNLLYYGHFMILIQVKITSIKPIIQPRLGRKNITIWPFSRTKRIMLGIKLMQSLIWLTAYITFKMLVNRIMLPI